MKKSLGISYIKSQNLEDKTKGIFFNIHKSSNKHRKYLELAHLQLKESERTYLEDANRDQIY